MDTVDPIGPVDRARPDLKHVTETQSPLPDGPSLDALTQRFQALMQQPEAPTEASALGKVLDSQHRLEQYSERLSDKLMEEGHTLDHDQLQAASRELMRTSSIGAFRQQAIVSIAQSTNKSLQTLLKNA